MTYRGQVKGGVVVFDGPRPADGTIVRVEVEEEPDAHPARGSAERILSSSERWHGDSGELDRLLDELREEKQAEMEAKQALLRRRAQKPHP